MGVHYAGRKPGRLAKWLTKCVCLSGALAFVLPLAFAQTAPSPAFMPAPMIAPVPVEIPVPIPSTINAPSQGGGQMEEDAPPDQPDLPCSSRDDAAASRVGASEESRIERGRRDGCD